MTALTLTQTCIACPSQWEGKLRDGRMFYARYRWGNFSLRVSVGKTDDVMAAVHGDEILSRNIGDGLDGHMTTEDMISISKDKINFKDVVIPDTGA